MAFPKSSSVSPGDIGRAEQYNNLRDDVLEIANQDFTFEGVKTFTSSPQVPLPINNNDAANKQYVDEFSRTFTYGEAISVNNAVYLASDGKVYKTNAQYADERITNFLGFAKESGGANDVKRVQIGGVVDGFSGLTAGSFYYLSNTAGGISTSPGTYYKFVGIAISASKLLIIHRTREMNSVSAGDTLLYLSAGTASTNLTTYTSLKSATILVGGTVKVGFEMFGTTSATVATIYARIYVNGSPVGTERSMGFGAPPGLTPAISYDENINVNVGDVIAIYGKTSHSNTDVYIKNFTIRIARKEYVA